MGAGAGPQKTVKGREAGLVFMRRSLPMTGRREEVGRGAGGWEDKLRLNGLCTSMKVLLTPTALG